MPTWRPYWIKVARRCQVQVLSTSRRYADGRPALHSGIRGRPLTDDEVEAELQGELPAPADRNDAQNDTDIDSIISEDDFLTDTSSSSSSSSSAPGTSTISAPSHRKRKHPTAFYHAETQHLEAIDRTSSLREEHTLWTALGLPASRPRLPPPIVPSAPGPAPEVENPSREPWMQGVGYVAEWENPDGRPGERAFEEMGARGRERAKRRRLWGEKMVLGGGVVGGRGTEDGLGREGDGRDGFSGAEDEGEKGLIGGDDEEGGGERDDEGEVSELDFEGDKEEVEESEE